MFSIHNLLSFFHIMGYIIMCNLIGVACNSWKIVTQLFARLYGTFSILNVIVFCFLNPQLYSFDLVLSSVINLQQLTSVFQGKISNKPTVSYLTSTRRLFDKVSNQPAAHLAALNPNISQSSRWRPKQSYKKNKYWTSICWVTRTTTAN